MWWFSSKPKTFPCTLQDHQWLWNQSSTVPWSCPKGKRIHQPVLLNGWQEIKLHHTTYMHTVPNHVPIVVKQNSTMKQFTGQGVEKNNDAKRLLFQKSNKWNAARDVLHLELRQLALQGIFLSSPIMSSFSLCICIGMEQKFTITVWHCTQGILPERPAGGMQTTSTDSYPMNDQSLQLLPTYVWPLRLLQLP